MYLCVYAMLVQEKPETVSDSLELEITRGCESPEWAVGMELQSSGRAAGTINH